MADKELQVSEKQEVSTERGEFTREGAYFTPAVDICETEKQIMILADMPGVKLDGVDVELKEGVLTIDGKVSTEATAGEHLLTEYRRGNYFRSFRVSDSIDAEKITATMSNGVLNVTLPKAEKVLPRKIEISAG